MALASQQFYEFEGLRLYVNDSEIVRLADGARFSIRPKERDFLKVLLEHAQQTVPYDVLHRKVWPEVVDSQSVVRTMRETKRTLDALLRDVIKSPTRIIKTVINEGYCVRAVVIKSNDQPTRSVPSNDVTERALTELKSRILTNRRITISCALYSVMFAVALPLEVAYKWDLLGQMALILTVPVFGWMLVSSVLGLKIDERLTMKGKRGGLAAAVGSFVTATILLLVCLSFFLPTVPITESTIQAYPAQAAYLKDAGSFLALAFFFLLLPSHFIFAVQYAPPLDRQIGEPGVAIEQLITTIGRRTLYPRFWFLCLLLILFALIAIAGTAHLLDHLKPSPYMNLFVELLYLRGILYFGLGLYCLVWYYRIISLLRIEGAVLGSAKI
jgi:DNA-binding winged helix-turn-helix (wHTH) protein